MPYRGEGESGRVVVRAADVDHASLPMVFAAEQTAVRGSRLLSSG